MNIEKWINGNVVSGVDEEELVIPLSDLQALLETHAIVPREPSDEFCRNVSKQSCQYTSDMQIKTMLKFMIKAAENE